MVVQNRNDRPNLSPNAVFSPKLWAEPIAVQVMTENPYRLDRGIGFKTADAIAIRLGIEKTAMIRVRAGISYALVEAMDEGHC